MQGNENTGGVRCHDADACAIGQLPCPTPKACGCAVPTLLDILARDWVIWPGGSRVYQDKNGDIISSDGYDWRHTVCRAEIARDRATAVVTESKWRSARRVRAEHRS